MIDADGSLTGARGQGANRVMTNLPQRAGTWLTAFVWMGRLRTLRLAFLA